ncbi:hypothetical protein ACEWY4_022732 [Coilia grayii]|uniref:C1q domain-containing protein n=1 Tax=Coilia grayii TaxID=363190 RepID=A0ABD1J124_9TELE
MRAAISLLVLLFSMCGAQTQSTQTEVQTESQSTGAAAEVSTQLDVSAELKELRDMVVELRVALRYTQDDLKVLEAENNEQDTKLIVMSERLVASETKVGVLERVTAAQEAELTAVKTRLAASEAEVMNLRKENAALETRLAATETDVEDLKMDSAAHEKELAALKTRLAASETGIDDLKVENAAQEAELTAVKTRLAATETEVDNLEKITEKSKVAFSVGLTDSGYIESGNTDLNLVFSKVITNVGQAYSSTTGFFTAPVRGVYYFRFTVRDNLDSRHMEIQMFKNGQQLILLWDTDTDGQSTYLSSGLTLQLEVGDVVNMRLPVGHRLYDNTNNHCTFSGFLLFPL